MQVSKSKPDPIQNTIQNAETSLKEEITLPTNDSLLNKVLERHQDAPFYCILETGTFYITSSGKYNYHHEQFDGSIKYGLTDDSLRNLLPIIYDKIYNPNLVIKDCFEIKKDGKVGLYNYKTGQMMNTRFDYIMPEKAYISNTAYGHSSGEWFRIESSNLSNAVSANFDPKPIFKTINFNIHDLGNSMMYDSYYDETIMNDPIEGQGVVVVPSYLEFFGLTKEYFSGVILPTQNRASDFGVESAKIKTSQATSISERIMSYLISFYEKGIGGREYYNESKKLLVYDVPNNRGTSVEVQKYFNHSSPCSQRSTRFVNDSILEVKVVIESYQNVNMLDYDFETQFEYYQIHNDGSVTPLKSNRHFDFTKFIVIDENQFRGCFAKFMEDSESDEKHNIWTYQHLSIEDLDIMRNEIFAEYGYRFKSEKWQEYFGQKTWYEPKYDDVNDQLTEIDKANIKTILSVKEEMMKDELKFTQKQASTYYAAG